MAEPRINLLLYGSSTELPPTRVLRAGPLTLSLEAGDLRYITFGRCELIRRIYGTVRDRHWGTVPRRLTDVTVSSENDSFRATYRSHHQEGDIDFVWSAVIEGATDGTITFTFAGEAHATFQKNRIGLCVLHPMRECAGIDATVRRTSGVNVAARFPELIAVEQPIDGFTDIASLTYDVGGTGVHLAFEGEIFETEDQRNWIDASFKTYGTPLSAPRPVTIQKGTRIEQRVTLRVRPAAPAAVTSRGHARPLAAADREKEDVRMPAVGVGMSATEASGMPFTLAVLRDMQPAHLRVDLPLDSHVWQPRLDRALQMQRTLDCELELALAVTAASGARLESLASLLPRNVRVARVLVFSADHPTTHIEALTLVRQRLLTICAHLGPAGVGSLGDLYEFHLHPPPSADLLCWSMNPHAHASDVTSLSETPPAAGEQVRTIKRRHPHAFAAVSPITLRPRVRPSSGPPREPHPLHRSLFGAAWTLAMGAHLAAAGAGSATFFEGAGELGTEESNVHPLFHVLNDLCDCAGATVITAADTPDDAASLLVRHDDNAVLLLANLTRRPRALAIPRAFAPATVRVLDAVTAIRAASKRHEFRNTLSKAADATTIELGPFATARVNGHLIDRR